jgi:hypothetical protein
MGIVLTNDQMRLSVVQKYAQIVLFPPKEPSAGENKNEKLSKGQERT